MLLLPLLLPSPALAEDAPSFPRVSPFGQVFAQYGFDLTDGAKSANSFDISRAHLGLDADLTTGTSLRVLVDGAHALDGSLGVFVKNAWIEGHGFLPGVKVRFGVVDTGYSLYQDVFSGRRYQGKTFSDAYGLLPIADLGVNVQGRHLDGLLSWHVAALNGEGFKAMEVDAGKTLTARVTVDPLARGKVMELPITGFVSYAAEPEDGVKASKLIYAADVGFKYQKNVTVTAEYVGFSQDGLAGGGYSIFVAGGAPKIAYLDVRFDHFDPDGDTDDDATSTLRAGPEHFFGEKIAAALLYERAWTEATPDTATHGIFVKAQAGF